MQMADWGSRTARVRILRRHAVQQGRALLRRTLPARVPGEGARVSELVFKIVRHDEVAAFERLGWTALDALNGTHHGTWSTLMEWTSPSEPVLPKLPPIFPLRRNRTRAPA